MLPSDWHVQELQGLSHGRWVFAQDKLYLGVGHFVTEINLHTGRPRYLLPDKRFPNDGIRWEAPMDAVWKARNAGAPAVSSASLLAKRQLLAEKLAVYEKLESEGTAQLEHARGDIDRCYQLHGLPSKNSQNFDPFFKLIVKSSGEVQQIVFFDGASPGLKACLIHIIQPFRFSTFTDDETVTMSVNDFRCRVTERAALME